MNWNDYRKAVDKLPVSPNFQARTEALVHEQSQSEQNMKEYATMRRRLLPKLASIAAVIALLAVSAFAAVRILSPGEVADLAKHPILAEAFRNQDAVVLNESVETGDFRVTLTGLVSGKGLTEWSAEVNQERTYAVVALERVDGAPLDLDFPFSQYTLTPLVGGFTPWSVNSWTLDAAATCLDQDGVYYYLLDTQSLEMFADHTVYLAFYEGFVPSRDMFVMGADETIAFAEDFQGLHAMFSLPLDKNKADPAAVEAFMADSGFDQEWFLGLPADESSSTDEEIPVNEDAALLS